MLTQLRLGFLAMLAVAVLGCQNGDSSVREEARKSLESNSVQPAQPAQPASNESVVPAGPTTTMTFEEQRFDFGEVTEGEVVAHTYKFKNTGSEPLIISRAKGSCGCTVPKYTTDPVPPGGEGEMVVEFNTRGKKGRKSQKVTITANTNPPQTFIYIEGKVNPKEGAAEPAVNTPSVKVNQ